MTMVLVFVAFGRKLVWSILAAKKLVFGWKNWFWSIMTEKTGFYRFWAKKLVVDRKTVFGRFWPENWFWWNLTKNTGF